MSCRTCKHLSVPLNKAGKKVIRKNDTYQCIVTIPAILLPDSITKSYGFQDPAKASRRFMSPDEGTRCPFHENIGG